MKNILNFIFRNHIVSILLGTIDFFCIIRLLSMLANCVIFFNGVTVAKVFMLIVFGIIVSGFTLIIFMILEVEEDIAEKFKNKHD